jgi:hypothetical protein
MRVNNFSLMERENPRKTMSTMNQEPMTAKDLDNPGTQSGMRILKEP